MYLYKYSKLLYLCVLLLFCSFIVNVCIDHNLWGWLEVFFAILSSTERNLLQCESVFCQIVVQNGSFLYLHNQ